MRLPRRPELGSHWPRSRPRPPPNWVPRTPTVLLDTISAAVPQAWRTRPSRAPTAAAARQRPSKGGARPPPISLDDRCELEGFFRSRVNASSVDDGPPREEQLRRQRCFPFGASLTSSSPVIRAGQDTVRAALPISDAGVRHQGHLERPIAIVAGYVGPRIRSQVFDKRRVVLLSTRPMHCPRRGTTSAKRRSTRS